MRSRRRRRPRSSTGIFEALGQSKAKGVGAAVVGKLKDLPPAARPVALRLVLAKADSARAFLDAVEKGTLRFDMLALDQRTALATHPDKELADRAKKLLALGGGLPEPRPAEGDRGIQAHPRQDRRRGRTARRCSSQHCAKCHKHGGEGTQIGPDLTGFAVHPKEEILIHVLDPSRSVEGNFKLYRVVTTDEPHLIGILGAQTATSIEIIDAEAKRHALRQGRDRVDQGDGQVAHARGVREDDEARGTDRPAGVPDAEGEVRPAAARQGRDDRLDEGHVLRRGGHRPGGWSSRTGSRRRSSEVPFVLVDPEKDTVKNVVMLYGPQGNIPPKMPKSVSLPFNGKAKAIHILGGIGGWAAPYQPARRRCR